ncbi:hypothetical protein [Tabrizicola sp.]|uniref:hypothetical protein n=1 Tax=Tabrizicola sp. TaxID=2005166 RepID=UPI003D297D7D
MRTKTVLQSCVVSAALMSPVFAQTAPDVRGYWAGGYTNGQGGEIQFQMTVIDEVGELKYDASSWGSLGFAICEYVFPVENGVPGKLTRNSGAGTGECLAEPAFTVARPTPETLTLTFSNPEFELDVVEMGGVLRPFDPSQAHVKIEGLDILGIAPGMTMEQIEPLLTDKEYTRQENRDRVLEYQGFTIEQKAWGKGADQYDNPTDWVFVTFTAKKEWLPDEAPVATDVAREWNIPEADGIAGATMVDTLAKKYGPRSNDINEDRLYDRSGQVLVGEFSCPQGIHQPLLSNYTLASEVGEEEVSVTCGAILKAYVGTDSSTGRATLLKIRLTDPDPLWADFWSTWGHNEAARLKSIYDGVTGATGAAPEL